jgi:LPXTG-motif cell wall-anchored protein
MAVGLAAALLPAATYAQTGDGTDDGYVTTTTAPGPSIDVSAFSPECIRDAPFINFTIVPVGFTPVDGSATLVIRAANGTLVDTVQVTSLSGQILWPGAQVDSAGNATDWPGWRRADDGVSWIPDPSDAFLREGLVIEVTVNPTATATVSYPPATSVCANPPTDDEEERPCQPGDPGCALPSTGGGPGNLVLVGAAALLVGLLMFTTSRRRRTTPPSAPLPPPTL